MHELLEFVKGIARLAVIGGVSLIVLALISRNSSEPFDWLVLLGPILPVLSWLGIDIVAWSDRSRTHRGRTSASRFCSMQSALDYLAGRIAAEAELEGAPLSETERKMLYFSEVTPTLHKIRTVSAEFDRTCDEDVYEQKISTLAEKIRVLDTEQDHEAQAAWDEAIETLTQGDFYVSVLLSPSLSDQSKTRPRHDGLKLWLTAFSIVFAAMAFFWLGNLAFGERFWGFLRRLNGR